MKSTLKYVLFTAAFAGLFISCEDDDTTLAPYEPLVYGQDFDEGADNTLLVTTGWINFAETGSALWKIQKYSGNGYAEFTTFNSGDAVNVGWLVSPAITLEENNSRTLRFFVSQSFVSSPANKLEVLVSTDFDGTNVTAATWTPVNADIPGTDAEYFLFQDSGKIDLSAFSGNVHVAFKVTGSGTNTALDGSYQIDKFRVY